MRTLLIAVAALFVAAGAASAQVAAPSLNPTPTFRWYDDPGLVDDAQNPAVLPWGGPSRVAASYGTAKLEIPVIGKVAEGKAMAVEGQFVGETLAASVHTAKVSLDATLGTGGFDLSRNSFGVAAQFGGWLSVGAGMEKRSFENPNPLKQTESLTLGGATLRLGNVFYLGAAGGSATVKDEAAVPADEVKASAARYGIAYRWRDKDRGVHVEWYHTQRAAKASPLGFSVNESSIDGYSVEFVFAQILLSVVGHTDKQKDTAGILTESMEQSTVSLGYVPEHGFAIVGGASSHKVKNASGVEIASVPMVELGVAFQF